MAEGTILNVTILSTNGTWFAYGEGAELLAEGKSIDACMNELAVTFVRRGISQAVVAGCMWIAPETKVQETATISVSMHREGSTWYAFTDEGELLTSGSGPKSCLASLAETLVRRGISQALVDGRLWTAPETKVHQ